MFQNLSLERLALALFAGALTLIAATMAFARTPTVLDDTEQSLPATPVVIPMLCRKTAVVGEQQILARFTLSMKTNFTSDGGAVVADVLGTCQSNAPASAYNVIGPSGSYVDVHTYTAGGTSCKESDGSVSFTVNFDRKQNIARTASLTVSGVTYDCELR